MAKKHDIIELKGQVQHETTHAYLFWDGKIKPVWLPKSQCEWNAQEKKMQLPEWLAIEKGLI